MHNLLFHHGICVNIFWSLVVHVCPKECTEKSVQVCVWYVYVYWLSSIYILYFYTKALHIFVVTNLYIHILFILLIIHLTDEGHWCR